MGADVFYRTVLGPAKKSDSVAARPKAPQAMFTLTRGQSSTQNHLTRTTKTWGYVRVCTPTYEYAAKNASSRHLRHQQLLHPYRQIPNPHTCRVINPI